MSDTRRDTVVELAQGALAGTEKHGVLRFRGIPYAAPPVGQARWRPPGPAPAWDGVREARAFGPRAMQNPSPLEQALGADGTPMSEDCLSLNVWTPGVGGRRPVMVWIHGGGFSGGSSATPWYDGTRFAQRGVVVVTINYRLGSFGFLHLGDCDGAWAGSGNAGICDQVAALEWVRDNIAAFGGDPGNVTIFGESAGAMSVATLLGLPRARGLFHRAILQSGAAHNVHDRATAHANAARILAGCGLGTGDVAAAVDLPASALLDAQAAIGEEELANHGLLFQPVVDGAVLDRPPLDVIADGLNADVPVVIGTTADEWALFELMDARLASLGEDGVVRRARRLLGDAAADVVAAYRASRPEVGPGELFSALMTDWVFRIPALRLAEAHVRAGGRAHVYEFRWASTAFDGRLRSCHALDIPFVFDVLDKASARMFTGPGAPQELATAMNGAWAAFAHTGDPGWPAYEPDTRLTQVFDTERAVVADPRAAERRVWDGLR
jgi:para-nitrobenzyl esterase